MYIKAMKVVHFVTDEKFINSAIELFESITWIDNTFYIVEGDEESLSYIKNPVVKSIKENEIETKILDEKFAEVIVMHSLGALPNDIIIKINKKIKLVWLSWGWDLYSNVWPEYKLIKIENRIKDSFTNVVYNWGRLFLTVKRFLNYSLKGCIIKNHKILFKNALRRIDYYSGVYPIEYDLLLRDNKDVFKAQRIDFNYTRKIKADAGWHKKNGILIGNSASCLLNHCDIFERLKSFDLSKRQVFVPLCYETGNRLYLSHVRREGYRIFGDSFVPVDNFMNFSDFCNFLKNCSVAIFDIEQQAASGTISLCLGLGMKVFLPQSSIPYSFYKGIGVRVYSIESELNENELKEELLGEERISNREIVMSYFSYENVLNRVEKSFRRIYNDIAEEK